MGGSHEIRSLVAVGLMLALVLAGLCLASLADPAAGLAAVVLLVPMRVFIDHTPHLIARRLEG